MTVRELRPPTGLSRFPLFLLLAYISACRGEGVSDTPAFEVLDSAGVEIVTVHRSLWKDGQAWTVSTSPMLEIGQMDADPAYELSRVRGVVRLSDGRIVVGEAGASELRYFDAHGEYIRTVGRKGEGPGEFSSLFGIYALGDTVFAYDYRLSRVTLFGAEGDYLEDVTLGRESGRPLALYPFRDGFLGVTWSFPEGLNEDFTYSRRPSVFRVFGGDGVPGDALDELPGEEMVIKAQTDGASTTTLTVRPLMGHSLHQAMVGATFVAGTTDRFEVRVYDEMGRLARLIRAPSRDVPVTHEEWEAVIAEELHDAETASWRSSVLEIAELRPAPDIRPAYGRFVADREGYVWLAPYRPASGQPVPWLVVEVDGTIMGDVELPEGFTPLEIGTEYVIGVVRDDFDVPYVRMYHLTR
jgi:6-bladed beta-propeller